MRCLSDNLASAFSSLGLRFDAALLLERGIRRLKNPTGDGNRLGQSGNCRLAWKATCLGQRRGGRFRGSGFARLRDHEVGGKAMRGGRLFQRCRQWLQGGTSGNLDLRKEDRVRGNRVQSRVVGVLRGTSRKQAFQIRSAAAKPGKRTRPSVALQATSLFTRIGAARRPTDALHASARGNANRAFPCTERCEIG